MDLKGKREKIIVVCATAAVFAVAAFMCRPVFYLNDDVTMRSILSGSYTGIPDGHAVYMKYPLTGALRLLYSLWGRLPWLELLFAGCLIWSAAEIITVIADRGKALFWAVIVGNLFVLPFYGYMHYTTIAAVLAGTAVFLLCTEKAGYKSVAFWLLAWMIRSQVAYLSVPFLGVALLWRVAGPGKNKREKELPGLIKTGAAVLAGLLLCTGMNRLAYADEDWQEYLEYNEVRTELFDYTNFHSTDHYSEYYEQYGMTEDEYLILYSYNTILDTSIDTEKIRDVSDKVSTWMEQERDEAAWIRECIRQYYYRIRYSDSLYVILWGALFVTLMFLLVLGKNWLGVLLMICLGSGRSLIWIYLIYRGRFPDRIAVSLYAIELLLLLGMLWNLPSACKEKLATTKGKLFQALFLIGAICVLAGQVRAEGVGIQEKVKVQKEWTALKEYCEEKAETLFLMDVFSAVEYGGLQYEQDCSNLMLAGGWMSASPLALQRFESRGMKDGGQALYEEPMTAFLADKERNVEWLERYLTKTFGECKLEPIEEIACGEDKVFIEYRVVK